MFSVACGNASQKGGTLEVVPWLSWLRSALLLLQFLAFPPTYGPCVAGDAGVGVVWAWVVAAPSLQPGPAVMLEDCSALVHLPIMAIMAAAT